MAQLSRATEIAPQTLNNWVAGQEQKNLSQIKRVADIQNFNDEINAGVFEVVLRRVRK